MIKAIKSSLAGNSLKARFLRGSAWLAVGNIVEKILAFVSKIILARLLMPEELGVIVLIASITGLFECLTEVGVKQCIIQSKKGDTQDFMDAVWWFSAIRSCILFALAWVLSPLICRFYFEGQEQVLARYDWPMLYAMVQVAFLSVLFNGFISPRAYLQEKQFNFARVVAYMQSAALTGTILTIILSFVLRNAWAMVLGFVCQVFLRVVMSYVLCPFLPRVQFHRESWREVMQFARGMWGAPFFAYIAYNIDVLAGGKIVGPELIGLYGFAVGLAYIPRELFGRIINPVLMPAFAERQDNKEKLRKAIGHIIGGLILMAVPVIVPCFLFHRPLITVIYGESFAKVSLILAIMTVNVFLIMINMVFVNLFFGMGKPEIIRNYTLVRAIILVCLIVPIARLFGLIGMATMQVICNFALVVLFARHAGKLISLNVYDMLVPAFLKNK
jgi:lipopolysaccharide exporter